MFKKRSYILITILFLLITVIFSYFRLKSTLHESIPYTYDQGRDFLRAAMMVDNRDPVFIGPTTGIEGIFHGSWWYYYLAIPYILFQGLPIGFYYFNFLVHALCTVIIVYLIYKYLNKPLAFFTAILLASSPYFISTSIFVGNNIMVLPAMVLFIISHFLILEKLPKKRIFTKIVFLSAGASIGLITEFEFAFGIMLLPIYFLLAILYKPLREKIFKTMHFLYLSIGGLIIFAPRILFELKNNFSQTIKLINYFFNQESFIYKSLNDRISERFNLFKGFYEGLFTNQFFAAIFAIFIIWSVFFIIKKRKLIFQNSLLFFSLLLAGLFFISLAYKDSFWSYYYEGLPYLFLSILILLSYNYKNIKGKFFNTFIISLASILTILSVLKITNDFNKIPKKEGLYTISQVVSYIHQNEKNLDNYCVIIYTPPAIPYTYNYMFHYNQRFNNISYPKDGWTHDKCWFVIEADTYEERRDKWIKDRIPENAKKLDEAQIQDVLVQKWEYIN
jgi:hypothetical protein